MSRSGYSYDCDDQWANIRYRGALKSAVRGARGQAFLKEMLAALDALPEKRLITHELIITGEGRGVELIVGADRPVTAGGAPCSLGEVCAIGALGLARSIDMSKLDPEDPETVASVFDVNEKMVREIVFMNDEGGAYYGETPEKRFERMRAWVANQIISKPEENTK